MRVHMDPADSENLFAVGSPVRAAAPSTSYLLRRQAHSDMWVSGFSLRAQVSGQSQSILCEMRLANKDGTPRSYKERQSAIWMSTRLDWYETGFAPVFVPKGAIYFVGYRSPDPSTGQILVEPAGTPFGSSHFSKGPNQTTWVGPSGAPQHAFAVNSACATRNDALTDQFRKSWAADTEHAIADTAPSDMWVHGFSIWARHSLPGQRMLGRLYADASGKPGQLLRERSVEMQSSTDWHRVHFDWPVFLRKGQAYHLAIVTPSGSGLSDVELIVGSVYHEEHSRPASGGVWQAQGRKALQLQAARRHGGAVLAGQRGDRRRQVARAGADGRDAIQDLRHRARLLGLELGEHPPASRAADVARVQPAGLLRHAARGQRQQRPRRQPRQHADPERPIVHPASIYTCRPGRSRAPAIPSNSAGATRSACGSGTERPKEARGCNACRASLVKGGMFAPCRPFKKSRVLFLSRSPLESR
jgi:hypothetical protein